MFDWLLFLGYSRAVFCLSTEGVCTSSVGHIYYERLGGHMRSRCCFESVTVLKCVDAIYIHGLATFELQFGSTRKCHKHLWFSHRSIVVIMQFLRVLVARIFEVCQVCVATIHIYIYDPAPPGSPPPPPKGGIRHTYAAMYRYNYMFVLIYVCMPVCLSVCLLVCKYVRVPARSTCHCFCVCTQRYYMYT